MMRFLQKHYSRVLSIGIYIVVFLFLIYPYSDYDWGWHYQYGKYFFTNGHILRDNIFSWTLPSYQWVNHSWAYDLFLFQYWNAFGFAGLSFFGALIAWLCFFIGTYPFHIAFWQLGILGLLFVKVTEETMKQGMRSQIFGLLLLSCLMTIILLSKKKPKLLFILPIVFLVWANVHGSFTFGLAVYGLYGGIDILLSAWKEKKSSFWNEIEKRKWFVISFCLSFLATLCNPFFYQPYMEALRHFDNRVLSQVFEWQPIAASCPNCNIPYFALSIILCIGLFFLRKRLSDIPFIVSFLFLTWQSIMHRRYLSIYMVTMLPVLALYFSEWKTTLHTYSAIRWVYGVGVCILLEIALFVKIPSTKVFSYSTNEYCAFSTKCSVAFSEYIAEHPPKGKGLNFYDWGGFLIGKGIQAKLFIDGRMHLWEENGFSPFETYSKIYYESDAKLFQTYNFDWLILRNDAPLLKSIESDPFTWGAWKTAYSDNTVRYLIR